MFDKVLNAPLLYNLQRYKNVATFIAIFEE